MRADAASLSKRLFTVSDLGFWSDRDVSTVYESTFA